MSEADIARVVATARRTAAAAQHAFTGNEHLLAALLLDQQGGAARALRAAGVSLDGLAEELLTGLPRSESPVASPPLSRFAERAVAQAKQSGGGELAAALLRAPKGRIASVLTRRGVQLQVLQAELSRTGGPADKKGSDRRTGGPADKKRSDSRTVEQSDRRTAVKPSDRERPSDSERRLPPHLERRPKRRVPWAVLFLVLVPVSVLLRWRQAPDLVVFLTSCLGVLPLAYLLGQATEQLAERSGPTVGGLLNATFGNAAELIIALVALRAGLVELVKASITGSILGNLLLILGLSLFAGGVRTPLLRFNRTSAGMGAGMLALAVAGLLFPALFKVLHPGAAVSELRLSQAVALILALTYGASLLFSLHTHRTVFGVDPASTPEAATWSTGKTLAVLALATAGIVVESELLVQAIGPATEAMGLSQTFVGLMLIPLIGNAAEHAAAVSVAWKGKLDLSLSIALGSSSQVALLVAPLLVFGGMLIGHPMNLVFTSLEVTALGITTVVVAIITLDGESHWFEGVQLLALYGIVGAAAYFL